MMGRFMEENDAFFTNQSISPSHDTTNNLIHRDNASANNSTSPTIKKERLDADYNRQTKDTSYTTKTTNTTYEQTNNSVNGRRHSNEDQWRTSNATSISLAN